MNRQNFATKLITNPWNIDSIRARTIIGGLIRKLVRNDRPETDESGYPSPKMQIVGGVAVIPIMGTILMNVPQWIKDWIGCDCFTDANDIEQEITEALNNENVQIIVFTVDSPGGIATASDKLFDVIEAANKVKPCFAYCADGCDMASAAYEAVAPCREIRAGFYAVGIGCIGSYIAYLDDTEFWAQMGISFEIFRSGELKGLGASVPLSEYQRNYLQSLVDRSGAIFRANVKKYRTAIADEDMQGQWFDGKSAAARGFVSGCDKTFDAAIRRFQASI
jgi:ClpP class serine protease